MEDLQKKIGQRIKALRLLKGVDQQTLAQRAGVERSYISLIENGKKSAAVSTLALIADGLGVSVGELFEDSGNYSNPQIAITRKKETPPPDKKTSFGYTFTPLCTQKRHKIMDAFFTRAEPHRKQKYDFVHRGEEFLYVLQGAVKLTYGGEIIALEEGDTAYFDSSVPHRLEVNGSKTTYYITVNSTGLNPQIVHPEKQDI